MRERGATRVGAAWPGPARAAWIRPALLALAASSIAAAGCGGGGDDTGSGGTSTTLAAAAAAPVTGESQTAPTTIAEPLLTTSAQASTSGLGVVRVGATPEAAAEAAGTTFADEGQPVGDSACRYVTPLGGPTGVRFMVSGGHIARIDIDGTGIQTLSGAGVGSTREEIIGLFGDKIVPEAHPDDPAGEWLVFVPADAGDAERRVVFETDGTGTVVRYRTGRLPEVLYVAGCADAL